MGIPPEEASKWFWKAAEQGHAGAQYFLEIYFLSAGGEKSVKKRSSGFKSRRDRVTRRPKDSSGPATGAEMG